MNLAGVGQTPRMRVHLERGSWGLGLVWSGSGSEGKQRSQCDITGSGRKLLTIYITGSVRKQLGGSERRTGLV